MSQTAASIPDLPPAEIAVIGGSGLSTFLDGGVEVRVETPYGDPSDVITVGEVDGRRVTFLPRHGRGHRLAPHGINYRANLWALRALGVRQVIAAAAVGSLRTELPPGTLVVPDQLVDRTSGRVQTYFESGANHVPFADPYCGPGRLALLKAAAEAGSPAVDGGTMVVVEGPRFSTRAESRWFAAQGWSLVNMTGHPEAVLARELALCYTTIALVTDLDAGVDADSAVSQEEVFALFADNVERLRGLLADAVRQLPRERDCACTRAHDGLQLPITLP